MKVKFTQIAITSGRPLYALDDKGRVWQRAENAAVAHEYVWSLVEAPDEPQETA